MRVVIAKKTLSTVGGSEMFARSIDRELRALGHEVTLVGMRPAWSRPGVAEDQRSVFLPVRGGRVGAAIDGLLPTTLVDQNELRHAIKGADIVHSVAREWAGALEHASRAEGAAFVETPLVHPGQLFSGDGARDIARYRRDDAVIALTEWEAGWYREHGVPGVHVTGIGPNLLTLPEVAREPATILFVGRKERYKGYHALRAAAPAVWRERPDARFIAIGQAAWTARLSSPMRDPRWAELGVVSEDEKARAFARASIFAMPSDHETFGHTYLEAWMAGLPVIAGDIPPLREVVREGIDGLHTRNDAGAVAAAILTLLRDPERARRMGESGRQRALSVFTWSAVAKKTEAAYRDALTWRQRGRHVRRHAG
ncbi:MAG: glycosyltransferase family 4 protein [Chloroflexota bacterium]|nr:glycosyltransferase family 4 protein [Chloroflexota bacterium]